MKPFSQSLGLAALAGLTWLPLYAEQATTPIGPVVPVVPVIAPPVCVAGPDWQATLDGTMASPAKSGQASPTPEALGKELETILQAIAKDRADGKAADFYTDNWKLLRLLPAIGAKSKDSRAKIAVGGDKAKSFITLNEPLLNSLGEQYVHFKQKLGLRSDKADQAALKAGIKGGVDESKGANGLNGDLVLGALPPGGKFNLTDADKGKIALFEAALKKLLAADAAKIPADFVVTIDTAEKNLENAWYFQVLYKTDPKVGDSYPETLKFLRSINHGLGDLSRYETALTDMGWKMAEFDTAASEIKPAAAMAGADPKAPDPAVPAGKPVEAALDAPTAALVKAIEEQIKITNTQRSKQQLDAFYKAQLALLRAIPEIAYKDADTQALMMKSSPEMKALINANRDSLKNLGLLVGKHKLRLGLMGAQAPARMTRTNPQDPNNTRVGQPGGGDINIDGTEAPVMPTTITANDGQRLAAFEQYLKRLRTFHHNKDVAGAESDFHDAAKMVDGAYYFQLLFKDDPRFAITYPNTFFFLQQMEGGDLNGQHHSYPETLGAAADGMYVGN